MTGASYSCGACKFLRRRCTNECVFTPYFCYSQGADHFAAVHKIFGASNASKLLMKLPLQDRSEAAISICYEALARVQDPVYGCVAQIFALEQQVAGLQEEIDQLSNYMTYVSFGLPNCMTYVSSEINGTSISDHLNQQTPPLFAAPQASSPSLAILEGQNSHSHSLLDHPLMESFEFHGELIT